MLRIVLIAICFSLFFACKSKKKILESKPEVKNEVSINNTTSNDDILHRIENQYAMPEWFSARGSIDVEMNDNAIGLDAVIQLRKDSAILLVAKKFGFEGGRALITPDSVFIINRLEQTFDKLSLSEIAAKFNLPPHFDAIQKIIVGCPFRFDKATPFEMQQQDSTILLTTEKATIGAIHYLNKKDFLLRQLMIEDEQSTSKMTMLFSNYKLNSLKKMFSFSRELSFFNPQSGNGQINIAFADAEFNIPKTLRFQIPSHYKRKKYLNN